MPSAIDGSVGIAAYMALFAGVGFAFVFANLLIGRILRPNKPNPEKLEIYECGEPTIGSSFVQFDLRFYVVALIFIIFDVEVAFLFPWATVFGKANELARPEVPAVVAAADGSEMALSLAPGTESLYRELGFRNPQVPTVNEAGVALQGAKETEEYIRNGGARLLWLATVEVLVFFVILLIAFAYEWKLGALDWVRALTEEFRERNQSLSGKNKASTDAQEPVLSA